MVPDHLFFSSEQPVDLNEIYGTKNKTYKVRGLIDILDSYKFTVDENTPIEEEIALDPELLGKVFENLLASYNPETQTTARKQTGSFYTPREIVNYMVDESLIVYLSTSLSSPPLQGGVTEGRGGFIGQPPRQTSSATPPYQGGELIEMRLRHLVAYNDDLHKFTPAEVDVLINAINTLKAIAPACGSGAFPMGVLHKLVYILGKLDPDNSKWRELQKQKAIKETEEAYKIGDKEEREKRLLDISEVFENNSSDYGRKLYLIENCIFGVDIQPIAVQIAKLRFFVSLIVDQRINPKKENLGVRPLPNLETKFVAANTLLGIEKPKQLLLRNPEIDKKEKELKEVRERHFTARTPQTKEKYRKADERLRAEISELLKKDGFPRETTEKLAKWNPYDQNASADFFDPEWVFGVNSPSPLAEVGMREWGFDIVLGNPPYGAGYSPSEKKYFQTHYVSTQTITGVQKGSLDTFSIFIELGYNLLKNEGNLSYIVPIAITSSDSMIALHKLLENNCHTIKISSYSVRPQPVFENAVVNTSILFFIKTFTSCRNIYLTKMYRKNKEFDLQQLVNNLDFIDVKEFKLQGRYPKISYPIEKRILEKIFKQDKKISDLLKEKGKAIYYRTTGGRYFKVITNYSTGSTKEKPIFFEKNIADVIGAILCSNLFFWFYQIYSNNLDLKSYEIESFTVPGAKFTDSKINEIEKLYDAYLKDIENNASVRQTTRYANINSFKEYKIGKSKKLIDKIDDVICPLYGLNEEEINFIKNYEIEYRLSDDSE